MKIIRLIIKREYSSSNLLNINRIIVIQKSKEIKAYLIVNIERSMIFLKLQIKKLIKGSWIVNLTNLSSIYNYIKPNWCFPKIQHILNGFSKFFKWFQKFSFSRILKFLKFKIMLKKIFVEVFFCYICDVSINLYKIFCCNNNWQKN